MILSLFAILFKIFVLTTRMLFLYPTGEMSSIEKINSIFELLRKNYKVGLTNKEISTELNIPASTCYRILAKLKKYNYVYQQPSDKRYFLGFAHLRFAEAVRESMNIATVCLPYLEDLHRKTDETTFVAIWDGKNCVALEVAGYINTRVSIGSGEIMPLHCSATGKAVLAFLPERERERVISQLDFYQYTKNTITNPRDLKEELEEIYNSGVAYCFQEFHNGINAMAVPIFDNRNSIAGALAIVGIHIDLDKDTLEEYAESFLNAGYSITTVLGGKYPDHLMDKIGE